MIRVSMVSRPCQSTSRSENDLGERKMAVMDGMLVQVRGPECFTKENLPKWRIAYWQAWVRGES